MKGAVLVELPTPESSDKHQHDNSCILERQGDHGVVTNKPNPSTRRGSKRNQGRADRVGLAPQQTDEKDTPKRTRPLTRLGMVRQQTGEELGELSFEASRLSLASTCDSSSCGDFDVTAWLSGGPQTEVDQRVEEAS